MTIHRLLRPLDDRGLDHVSRQLENRRELDPLQTIEITQNIVLGTLSVRSADAYPTANEVGATTVLDHGTQPIVAGGAAAPFEPYDAEI